MASAWSTRYPVYQIDFSAVAAGKRVSTTKRKIRWRFGYPNQAALNEGLTGTDCRGEEHDVTIVWSITSGKRQISMDGREIHYSTNRNSVLDFSWQTKGNHVIKVICHAAPPLSAQPGFRQYDLSIDGQSFFTMPKVYQIGIKGSVPPQVPGSYGGNPISPVSMGSGSHAGFGQPMSREQEEADLRRAIEASIQESRAHLGESRSADGRTSSSFAAPPTADLLDFGASEPPAPAPPLYAAPPADSQSVASMPSYYSAPTTYGPGTPGRAPHPPYASPSASTAGGALVPAVAPPGYYQAPPPYASPAGYGGPPPSYASPPPVPPAPAPTPAQYGAPQQNFDVFGMTSGQVDDPFAPKPPPPPTRDDLTSAILASYQAPPMPSTPGAPQPIGYYGQAPTPGSNAQPTYEATNVATPTLSMGALAITEKEEEPKSALEKALMNLVNVDHIDEPAEGEFKLTMMKKEEKKKQAKGKSVPLPPAGVGMVGSNAPLSQIKRDFEKPPKQTTEGIMNAPPPGAFHPNAAMAGALVVHGQGPPPLHQASGFGVGRLMPNGGFQNQQQMPVGGYMQQQQAQPQYR